ncbi:hypothetical protein uan_045 [Pseudomonas phage UAntarctica]|nr:hypothetical protein uan_045 [Pseudomonas phage UAntarctica]
MSKVIDITVQGTVVNGRLIAAYAKRVGSLDTILSVWANAATLQAAVHGNRNWMDSLFDMPVMRLQSGDLSKTGKEVLAYIAAHCPRVIWNKETKQIGLTKLQKESILATHFIAVGATAESETVSLHRNKFYQLHGDFALTLTGFKNMQKPEKEAEEVEAKMTAVAFAKQADKALECFKAERFTGTPDELFAAAVKAKALYLAIDAAHTAAEAAKLAKLAESGLAATGADILDTAKADELHKSGQGGKATRAGGKVELADAA